MNISAAQAAAYSTSNHHPIPRHPPDRKPTPAPAPTSHHPPPPPPPPSLQSYTLHPANHFPLSLTYKKWIKLTIASIQTLHQPSDFAGQEIYFLLNHPVEFVYILGVVVSVEVLTSKWGRIFVVLGVDDGSGVSMEVKVGVRDGVAAEGGRGAKVNAGDERGSEGEGDDQDDEETVDPLEDTTPASLKTKTFETSCPELSVTSTPNKGYTLTLAGQKVDIGTALKAKGTLSRYRDVFQLILKRAFVVKSVDEEVGFWEGYAEFAQRVLMKPWRLSKEQVEDFEKKERETVAQERKMAARREEKQRRRREHEAGRRAGKEAKMKVREARKEREWEALTKEMDGNALDMPGWKPWTIAMSSEASQPISSEASQQVDVVGSPLPNAGKSADKDAHDHNGPLALNQRKRAKTAVTDDLRKHVLKNNFGELPGFLRASALYQPDLAAIPSAHEQRQSKAPSEQSVKPSAPGAPSSRAGGRDSEPKRLRLSKMPIAGLGLSEEKIAAIAAATAGPHNGPWHHEIESPDDQGRDEKPAWSKKRRKQDGDQE